MELIKCGGEKLYTVLQELITEIQKKEKISKGWEEGIVITIYKKGDPKKCSNYREYNITTNCLQGTDSTNTTKLS